LTLRIAGRLQLRQAQLKVADAGEHFGAVRLHQFRRIARCQQFDPTRVVIA